MKANTKKALILSVCAVLLVCTTLFTTLAFLTDKTDAVTNTFTIGKVDIDLYETDPTATDPTAKVTQRENIKIIPGDVAAKDPTVEVKAGSEACWLYVKVTETNNTLTSDDTQKYILFDVITGTNGWTALDATNYPGVYYRQVAAADATAGITYPVIQDKEATPVQNKVSFNSAITSADAEAALTNVPTRTFKAYAIQSDKVATAAAGWAEVKD